MTDTVLWGLHSAHGPNWIKICDNPSRTAIEIRAGEGWELAICQRGIHPLDRCDMCNRRLSGYSTLKGLCGSCAKQLESGKASARIVVAESKAMAQRSSERRAAR